MNAPLPGRFDILCGCRSKTRPLCSPEGWRASCHLASAVSNGLGQCCQEPPSERSKFALDHVDKTGRRILGRCLFVKHQHQHDDAPHDTACPDSLQLVCLACCHAIFTQYINLKRAGQGVAWVSLLSIGSRLCTLESWHRKRKAQKHQVWRLDKAQGMVGLHMFDPLYKE